MTKAVQLVANTAQLCSTTDTGTWFLVRGDEVMVRRGSHGTACAGARLTRSYSSPPCPNLEGVLLLNQGVATGETFK